MTIAVPTDKPLIAIYACGGTGYNIANKYISRFSKAPELEDRVKVYFVDTSISNNNEHNDDSNTMVLGTGIGSGKKRGSNAEEIREAMPAVMQTLRAGVFNIILAGGSGGSGSTIANEMFRIMAMRDMNVVNFLVGSRASRTEIENLDKTFTTFTRVAKRYNKPALINYHENRAGVSRGELDNLVVSDLGTLSLFLSGHDDKIDITDIHHLFNYHKVTSFQPNVVGFQVFVDKFDPKPFEVVYSVGSLARMDESTDVDPAPEYQVAGYLQGDNEKMLGSFKYFHWAVLGNSFGNLIDDLQKRVKAFSEQAKAHAQDNLDRHATEDDDDIVL